MADVYRMHKEKSEYTPEGLQRLLSRAYNEGKPLLDVRGKPVKIVDISNNEQEKNKSSGEGRDSNPVAAAVHLAGLSHMSPSMNHTNISGNSGWFRFQKPILTTITKPPVGTEDLNKYIGLPLEAKMALNAVTGYTEISNIFIPDSLDNMLLKEEELELRDLLSGGVIL